MTKPEKAGRWLEETKLFPELDFSRFDLRIPTERYWSPDFQERRQGVGVTETVSAARERQRPTPDARQ